MPLTASLRYWWWVFAGLLGIAVVVAIGIVLSVALGRQTDELLRQISPSISDKDRADLTRSALQYQTDNLTKLWTGIVQAIGVVVLAVGGYFTYHNLRVTNEAQITNRFTQAITQLGAELKDGSPNLEVRLGGIYALERIARDSPRDHWAIMEVLTAYVRRNAPWPATNAKLPSSSPWRKLKQSQEPITPKPRIDVQAILTVLGRRTVPVQWPETDALDLGNTDLRGAKLMGAHLEGANMSGTHLLRITVNSYSWNGGKRTVGSAESVREFWCWRTGSA